MAEKTEQPTDKKIKDSAKKGQIFKSKDIVTALVLISGALATFKFGHLYDLTELMKKIFILPSNFNVDILFHECIYVFIKLIFPILFICFISGAIISLLQSRFRLATEVLKLDFTKLNPISGIKKIFSVNSIKELVKALLYFISIISSMALFFIIWHELIFSLHHSSVSVIIFQWGELCLNFVALFLGMSLIIILIDAVTEYFLFIKGLKMEKQEVKKEYKDNEGDPSLKRARKNMHQEILSEEIKSNIRHSTFVMTNPTHIAMLIYYDTSIAPLPFLLWKSHGLQAKMVIQYAQKKSIPVVKDIILARKLWRYYRKESFIDEHGLQSVMQIINWLLHIELQKMGIDIDDDLLSLIEK